MLLDFCIFYFVYFFIFLFFKYTKNIKISLELYVLPKNIETIEKVRVLIFLLILILFFVLKILDFWVCFILWCINFLNIAVIKYPEFVDKYKYFILLIWVFFSFLVFGIFYNKFFFMFLMHFHQICFDLLCFVFMPRKK